MFVLWLTLFTFLFAGAVCMAAVAAAVALLKLSLHALLWPLKLLMLPILLVFMIRLAGDRELMGSLVSGPINRAIAVLTAVIITLLSVLLPVITALGCFGVTLPGGSSAGAGWFALAGTVSP